MIRLQKFLAQAGIASRRKAEILIARGEVKVNGQTVIELGTKIDPQMDQVEVNGHLVRIETHVYFLLNKPDKTLVSTQSQGGKETIFSLSEIRSLPVRVVAVGRLDYRTTGLLLLTNDGELAHRLCHPRYKIPRCYHVGIAQPLRELDRQQLLDGIVLEDGPVQSIRPRFLRRSSGLYWYEVTVHEGRNRLVRRIFSSLEHRVEKLHRIAMGHLKLPTELSSGHVQELSAEQVGYLYRAVGLSKKTASLPG